MEEKKELQSEVTLVLEDVLNLGDYLSFLQPAIVIIKTGIAVLNVRDYLFIKKIKKLIFGFKKMNLIELENKKIDFWDDEKKEKIGMVSLNVLEKFDDEEKATLLGELLYLLICEKISVEQYLRLCHIISNTFYEDILLIANFPTNEELNEMWKKINPISLKVLLENNLLEEGKEFRILDINNGKFYFCKLSEYGRILKDILN